MSTLVILIAVAITLAALALAIASRRITTAWFRFGGQRLVICPEDKHPAGVLVNRNHAALTAWGGHPDLQLSGCSHWPDRTGCGQTCVAQIEAAPHDCLVRTILARWYEGKCCVSCGRPVDEFYWLGGLPALLVSDDGVRDWSEVPIEQLPDTLKTARAICFNCYSKGESRRLHLALPSQPHVG